MDHCWHRSPIQHAMVNHLDRFCCFCGHRQCVNYETIPDPDHGPYSPAKVIPSAMRNIGPCEARMAQQVAARVANGDNDSDSA